MGSKDQDLGASSGGGGGFFSSVAAGVPNWGTAVRKSVNGMVGYEGLEVINPDGGAYDAEAEVMRGQWKQETKQMNVRICTCVWYMLLHGLYQSTLRTSVRGSLSVPSLERRMRWLTIRALHLLLSRQNSWETQWKYTQLEGKWNNSMSYQPCDQEGDPLPRTELKEIWKVAPTPPSDKYQCTYFAHRINNFDRAPKKLLPSDFRLRPDRYALEKGDMSKSGAHKSRLEEQQRAKKKTRDSKREQFTPNMTEETGDLEAYEYNGKYTEHRAAIDRSSVAKERRQLHRVQTRGSMVTHLPNDFKGSEATHRIYHLKRFQALC